MIGSLIYIGLDILFNVLSWGTVKSLNGLSMIFYYLNEKSKINNLDKTSDDKSVNEIKDSKTVSEDLPSYENTVKKDDIRVILNQIENQKKMLFELEDKLQDLNSKYF